MARAGTVTVRVVGDKALVANIYSKRPGAAAAFRKTNRRFAREVRDLARQFAPVDKGNLRDALTFEMSAQDRIFSVFHDPAFFPDVNYAIFQELGFRHWQSGELIQRAHLFPAYEQKRREYGNAIAADVRRAIGSGR